MRERGRARMKAHLAALGGVALMVAGGLCIYGIDEPDLTGEDERLGIRRRVHFVGPGSTLIVMGLATLAGSALAMTRD
jgi:hypothetical protein